MHGFALPRIFTNLPKSMKIYPESAHSLKNRLTNQKGNRSHSKDPFIMLPKDPLTIQIDARCLPKTVPSLPKTAPRRFDTSK